MAQQNISTKLADLLTTRNFDIELKDEQGNDSNPDEAKVFSFDYVTSSGNNYGRMVLVLNDENEQQSTLQGFYGDNLGRGIDNPGDKEEFFQFMQQLSTFARRNRWDWAPSDLSKLKHTMRGMAAIKEGLFEGYYGNRRTSYMGEPTQARLMINHARPLGENDARHRYIESIFVETADGERHRLQFRNLAGAKAMLEHVRQGGKPYDVRGCHITEMVTEIAVLSRFNRASANRVLEGVTAELVSEAHHHYDNLRENLRKLGTNSGYRTYFESWHPAEITLHEELVDSIKTMFIEQTLDYRIEAALPVLARLRQNTMKEAEIFESWANRLVEGTWALPDTPEKWEKLQQLMSEPLMVGAGAMNATEQLDDIIGDDRLFDRLQELAKEDPNANCWDDTEVQARLQQLGVSLNVDQTPDQVQSNTERDGVSENKSMEFGKQNLVPWEGGASGGFGGGGGGSFGIGGRGGSPMNIDIGLGGAGRGTIGRQPEKFMGKAVQVGPQSLSGPSKSAFPGSTSGFGSMFGNVASKIAGGLVGAGLPLAVVSNLPGGGNTTPATNKAPVADKEPTAAPAADNASNKTPAAAPKTPAAAPKTPSTYKGTAGAQEIAKLSGISDVNKIKAGQTLTLPGGAGSYTVQAGDTLDKIAARQAPVSSTTSTPTSTPTSTSTPASDSMAPAPTATSPEAPSASIEKLKSFAPSIDEYESLMQKIGNRQEMMNKINQQIDDLPEGDNLNSFVEEDDDPMNYNAAITGSYYESSDPLARIKSLAFPNRTK
jgi:hypothetical protein